MGLSVSERYSWEEFEKTYRAYEKARGTDKEEYWQNCVVRKTLPIISDASRGLTIRDMDLKEDAMQVASIACWQVLENGKCRVIKGNVYSFLYQLARWRMVTVLENGGPKYYDLGYHCKDPQDFAGSVQRPKDVQNNIFLFQLRTEARKRVLGRLRFPEATIMEACDYILRCHFAGREPKEWKLKQRFKIHNSRFYFDYVIVLLRAVIYELKDEYGEAYNERFWLPDTFGGGLFTDRRKR